MRRNGGGNDGGRRLIAYVVKKIGEWGGKAGFRMVSRRNCEKRFDVGPTFGKSIGCFSVSESVHLRCVSGSSSDLGALPKKKGAHPGFLFQKTRTEDQILLHARHMPLEHPAIDSGSRPSNTNTRSGPPKPTIPGSSADRPTCRPTTPLWIVQLIALRPSRAVYFSVAPLRDAEMIPGGKDLRTKSYVRIGRIGIGIADVHGV